MTVLDDMPIVDAEVDGRDAAQDRVAVAPERVAAPDNDGGDERPIRLTSVALAAGLATAGAAWVSGGLIRGVVPELIALLGVVIGVGLTFLSHRSGRGVLQALVIPASAVVGAVLVAPQAKGGTANLPGLVAEAIQGGGLVQPPIPFHPGWRFILVVFFAVVGSAATSLAMSLRRPKLAVAVPLPVLILAALLQPRGQEVVASAIGTFLLIGAVGIAFGADLIDGDAGELRRSFELGRLMRGVAMLLVGVMAIVVLARADVLFPQTEQQKVIPPRRPPDTPLEPDRELFRVKGELRGPFRVGVLDEYDGEAWLLPPEDPSRLRSLEEGGAVPRALVPEQHVDAELLEVELRITDMRGLSLPTPPAVVRLEIDQGVDFDPRTNIARLRNRLPQGLEYRAFVAPLPNAAQLDQTTPGDPAVAGFITVPPAPDTVRTLLASAPAEPFSRLQFVRDELYRKVVLAGGGGPEEVTPERVAEMLQEGTQASPFEIAAAEALLARWAGVPARIGYGYHGGVSVGDGFGFRPKHGRAWLEAHFPGYGWVPLVGTPPKAASSLNEDAKIQDPLVKPTDDLSLVVYIPVKRPTFRLLFEVVRYWVLFALPFIVGIALLHFGHPWVLKRLRTRRRRRWGRTNGPIAEVLVSYADLRDRCYDLNAGDVRDLPLEFVERFRQDDEHDELAWLVTRLFWGDMRRDPRAEDVEEAATMAVSVQKRILRAQPLTNRILAAVSKASLRDPYSDDVPNLYPRILRGFAVRSAVRRVLRPRDVVHSLRRRALRPRAGTATLLALVMMLGSGGCSVSSRSTARVPAAYPTEIVRDGVLGLRFVREELAEREYVEAKEDALVSEGRVFTIHEGDSVQGAVQISLFRPEVDGTDAGIQEQVEEGIGGHFETVRIGTARLRSTERPEQRLYLWFPPERNAMVLVVVRKQYTQPIELVRRLALTMRGIDPSLVADPPPLRGTR